MAYLERATVRLLIHEGWRIAPENMYGRKFPHSVISTYNDRVGGRIGLGMAAGILLGPFGIPLAIGAENSQNEERKVWSREVHLACSSDTLPENLK